MVFALQVADDNGGLADAALRAHRGLHVLLGKLACRRLAKLLPSHVKDNGTAAVVDYDLAEWLTSPLLRPEEAAQWILFYTVVAGWERMGVALDRALSKLPDDKPRHPGVLRAQLQRIAELDFDKGGPGTEVYVSLASDYYVVADAFPTGEGIDGIYDWIGKWTIRDVLAADGTPSVGGDFVPILRDRFDPAVALAVGGCFDRLAKTLTMSLAEDEKVVIMELDAAETAVEMAAWVRRMLPIPAEIAMLGTTRTSMMLMLHRILVQCGSGKPLIVTPDNVMTVIQHHEAAKLVVGVNMGGIVALNMLVELLRLALGAPVTSIALGQLASGMALLSDLLPTLRSERVSGLPPGERLTYVGEELQRWHLAERTASRGNGGNAGGGTATPLAEVATSGGVGYGAIYQQQLRRLLASDPYVKAAEAVTAALDDSQYGEAITIIFSS